MQGREPAATALPAQGRAAYGTTEAQTDASLSWQKGKAVAGLRLVAETQTTLHNQLLEGAGEAG